MSKTKIELKYPYNVNWRFGYLVTNPENRKTLILYKSPFDKSSTQYARYLKAVEIGRYLTKDETVDHIDGDKTNDNLNNLQILSRAENNYKAFKKPNYILTCPICGKIFTRSKSFLRGKLDRAEKNIIACSRVCGGKLSHITKKNQGVTGSSPVGTTP